jgi:phosphoribosylformylglycinamidine synthase
MVGEMPDASVTSTSGFAREGLAIALVGPFEPSLVASELAARRGNAPEGDLPPVDLDSVLAAHEAVRDGVRSGAIESAHDISEGGLAVALAECVALGSVGCAVEVPELDDVSLFGEAPGRGFIVSGSRELVEAIPGAVVIGDTGGPNLTITDSDGERVSVAAADLREARDGGLRRFLP